MNTTKQNPTTYVQIPVEYFTATNQQPQQQTQPMTSRSQSEFRSEPARSSLYVSESQKTEIDRVVKGLKNLGIGLVLVFTTGGFLAFTQHVRIVNEVRTKALVDGRAQGIAETQKYVDEATRQIQEAVAAKTHLEAVAKQYEAQMLSAAAMLNPNTATVPTNPVNVQPQQTPIVVPTANVQ